MGNCFKTETTDDISLLNDDENEAEDDEYQVQRFDPPPPYRSNERESNMPVYHLTPNQRRSANQLSEEEQVKIAQRIGLIQHLPRSTWDNSQVENKKVRECCICMIDFEDEEPIRYLPCMHYYHVNCIDDWLMRSFTCPTCMEPVDAALLSSYGNHNVTTES
ncbi:RING finger protein 11-like isoform X2 [Styela clava]|uniref:RING finger protein 11-like isoform X2 n=1 Tax=Styela clava TaxID=7725 RepID=UPI0019399B07|nr:RING finger protein 11-like isoform X2 [Styela clava]